MGGPLRFDVGDTTVWCLCDGSSSFAPTVFPGVDEATRVARLAEAGLDGIHTDFRAYLIVHADGAKDLVDAGYGDLAGDKGGHITAQMAGLGVASGDIRSLIFTHLHGDHCGGALVQGTRVYAPETVVIHRDEIAHWQGRDEHAAKVLRAYADRIVAVDDGAALPGGLTTWALPGHTPGHMGLWIGAGFALTGDIVHSQALQLPDPDLSPIYDTDPGLAARTRRAALTRLAKAQVPFSGSHNIAPHVVQKVQAEGTGFRAVAP